jgi:hypothetical protein
MSQFAGPKHYGSFADFERDELQPMRRVGFSVADLEAEATFTAAHEELHGPKENSELDFG